MSLCGFRRGKKDTPFFLPENLGVEEEHCICMILYDSETVRNHWPLSLSFAFDETSGAI